MVGRRIFDNMWDPYSFAYAYPRPQYYRPRNDPYEVPVDHPNEQPLDQKTANMAKTVKKIPVTDGGAPAPASKPVTKCEDTAATEIQAFYRGYVVRKTQPLQHLKLIKKVKEELESLKVKAQEAEQRMKLRNDSKERLRWTEGVMALLLRLDSLQGVLPEVRLIRKAVTKELLGFQETIDSMSSVSEESNDVTSHETIGSSTAPAPEVGEEMEIEYNIWRGVEQDLASRGASEYGSDLGVKSNEDVISEKRASRAPLTLDDNVIDSVAPHCDENGLLASETIVEVGGLGTSETLPEDPMDAKTEELPLTVSPTHHMEEGETEPASSQGLTPETGNEDAETDMSGTAAIGDNPALVEEKETTGSDGDVIPATISTQSMALQPQCEQDGGMEGDSSAFPEENEKTGLDGRIIPATISTQPMDMGLQCELDGGLDADEPALLEEKETTGVNDLTVPATVSTLSMASEPQCEQDGGMDGDTPFRLEEEETVTGLDGRIIPARNSPQSTALELQCEQGDKQGNLNSLSDRALLLQVLEENRKLKDVLGKVLEWGKQQSDAIHHLTQRIEQLEEHQPPSKLLHGKDRKRVRAVDNVERSRRRLLEKGRRNRRQCGYADSEDWPSVESDEYF